MLLFRTLSCDAKTQMPSNGLKGFPSKGVMIKDGTELLHLFCPEKI